jgi:hypothetical protein
MINLNNRQSMSSVGLTVGKGIQTGAKHNVLSDAASSCCFEKIFRKSTAQHKIRSQASHPRLLEPVCIGPQSSLACLRDEADRNGVDENLGFAIQELVCRSQNGNSARGPASNWLSQRTGQRLKMLAPLILEWLASCFRAKPNGIYVGRDYTKVL